MRCSLRQNVCYAPRDGFVLNTFSTISSIIQLRRELFELKIMSATLDNAGVL